jgi:hypothetical protein
VTNITNSAVTIQISSQSIPSTPRWLGERIGTAIPDSLLLPTHDLCKQRRSCVGSSKFTADEGCCSLTKIHRLLLAERGSSTEVV